MSDANYRARAVWRCNAFWLGVENRRGRRTNEAGANEKSQKRRERNGEQMKEKSSGTRDGWIGPAINTQRVDNVSVPLGNKWG